MARLMVLLALVLLASVPPVAALPGPGDALLPGSGEEGGDEDSGCVHFEDDSDEGPVKVGQEEPGVFVGLPGEEGAQPDEEEGQEGPFNGVGVYYSNRDCELPGGDLMELLA